MRRWTTAAATAAVLGLVSGCGGGGGSFSDKSAQDIMKASASDMKNAQSLHISGDITTGGDRIGMDMQVTTAGACQGTMRLGGGTAQLLSDGSTAWMKADDAFWKKEAGAQASAVEQAVGDKWVVLGSTSGLSDLCDLDSLLKGVDTTGAGKDGKDAVTKEGTDSVGGADAVRLSGHDDSGAPMSIWVASSSPHYILKMSVSGGGSDSGALLLSDYDKPLDVKKPDPSEVVDLNSLG